MELSGCRPSKKRRYLGIRTLVVCLAAPSTDCALHAKRESDNRWPQSFEQDALAIGERILISLGDEGYTSYQAMIGHDELKSV